MSQSKKNNNTSNTTKIVLMAILISGLVIGGIFITNKSGGSGSKGGNTQQVVLSEGGDLVIPINEVTEKANFYPVEVEGTQLEVLAVKAPDGSIRTAFNTCQICYSSGRGYYKQNGDALICQNCGNSFSASDVEVTKGGCNPVPIFPEDKTVSDESITISNNVLTQVAGIFANWKDEY